jgi:hypothetical protein
MRSILFAAALMAFTPVLAQQAAPPPPPPNDTAAAEAAIRARAQAFEGRMGQMVEEMGAAIIAAGPDRAKRTADLDTIQARFQPEADAFASELEAFVGAQLAAVPTDQQAAARTALEAAVTQLRSLPATARAEAEQSADAPPAPTAQPSGQ